MLGHSDVAPERKEDPGELFDWPRLAAAGIGLWPADGAGRAAQRRDACRPSSPGSAMRCRATAGSTTRPELVIAAFQRHFRPERVDGVADPATLARLDGLLALL